MTGLVVLTATVAVAVVVSAVGLALDGERYVPPPPRTREPRTHGYCWAETHRRQQIGERAGGVVGFETAAIPHWGPSGSPAPTVPLGALPTERPAMCRQVDVLDVGAISAFTMPPPRWDLFERINPESAEEVA